jgi:hypothetical protein
LGRFVLQQPTPLAPDERLSGELVLPPAVGCEQTAGTICGLMLAGL